MSILSRASTQWQNTQANGFGTLCRDDLKKTNYLVMLMLGIIQVPFHYIPNVRQAFHIIFQLYLGEYASKDQRAERMRLLQLAFKHWISGYHLGKLKPCGKTPT